jgi:hypothetical protein
MGQKEGCKIMAKDAFWFHHDSNARMDDKMVRLRRVSGLEGVGLYWCVIECLRATATYKLPEIYISDLCFDLRCDEKLFEKLFECKLLENKNGEFFSRSLLKRMKKYDQICNKRSESGRLGAEAKRKQKESKKEAIAKQMLKDAEAKSSDEIRLDRNRIDEIGDDKMGVEETKSIAPPFKSFDEINEDICVDAENDWSKLLEAYPRKSNMKKSKAVYLDKYLEIPPVGELIAHVQKRLESGEWNINETRHIPNLETFIVFERWTDEITTNKPAPKSQRAAQSEMLDNIINGNAGLLGGGR